jgi:hypothetical protein
MVNAVVGLQGRMAIMSGLRQAQSSAFGKASLQVQDDEPHRCTLASSCRIG